MIYRTFKQTIARLEPLYGIAEANALARRLFEDGHGIDRRELMMNPDAPLSPETLAILESQVRQMEQQRPVQYIVGFEEFMGRKFAVDESVLIPRQETEELVRLIITQTAPAPRILDIGTGSGAIAVTLALGIDLSRVQAWDISPEALEIAQRNAQTLGAEVEFRCVDILRAPPIGQWDTIVSNPPYVLDSEREYMKSNVTDYEPHLALFVSDDDPLVFYRAIARFAAQSLAPRGRLYFEINQKFAHPIVEMLSDEFTEIEIINDIHGAQRMISCQTKR